MLNAQCTCRHEEDKEGNGVIALMALAAHVQKWMGLMHQADVMMQTVAHDCIPNSYHVMIQHIPGNCNQVQKQELESSCVKVA